MANKMPAQKPGRSKQTYSTPPELLAAVKKRLCISKFVIDLAADAENAVADVFYTEEDNALVQPWAFWGNGWCWLNPPFGHLEPWVRKAAEESQNGANIAMLVPASVGANWWKCWVESYAYQSFLNGRITFVGETTPYPKDCAILLFTPWGFLGHEIWRWKA